MEEHGQRKEERVRADRTVNPEQVADLAEHAHVYMTKDGRISMAGLNESNIQVSSNASHCGQCWLRNLPYSVDVLGC